MLLADAISFAARAHRDQVRKDGATPYIAHPVRVAFIIEHVFGCADEEVLAAAVLHDTIEDTTTDYDDLLALFGAEVARLVTALTKDPRMPEAEREREFFDRLAAGEWKTRIIKLADCYDNLLDSGTSSIATKAREKAQKALTLANSDEPAFQKARTSLNKLLTLSPPQSQI